MSEPFKPRRLLRKPEAMSRLGVGLSKFHEMIRKGEIKEGVEISPGGRAKGWPEHEIDGIIERRIAARDAKKTSS